jgi:hypothetical protein
MPLFTWCAATTLAAQRNLLYEFAVYLRARNMSGLPPCDALAARRIASESNLSSLLWAGAKARLPLFSIVLFAGAPAEHRKTITIIVIADPSTDVNLSIVFRFCFVRTCVPIRHR